MRKITTILFFALLLSSTKNLAQDYTDISIDSMTVIQKIRFQYGISIDSLWQLQLYSCSNRFTDAEKAYYNGQVKKVPVLLNDCINSHKMPFGEPYMLTKAQFVEASRIVAISNTFLRRNEAADQVVLNLLKVDPRYQLAESDPPEFHRLINSYHRSSTMIGFGLGLNIGWYRLATLHTVLSDWTNYEPISYKGKGSITFDLSIQKNLGRRVQFLSGLQLELSAYTARYKSFNAETTIEENQQKLNIPLVTRYTIGRKIRLYPELGFNLSTLVGARATFETDHTNNTLSDDIIRDYPVMFMRNKYLFSYIIGGGLQYTTEIGLFDFNIRYRKDLNSFTKEERTDPTLFLLHNYIENDVFSYLVSFAISYRMRLYHIRKMNRK